MSKITIKLNVIIIIIVLILTAILPILNNSYAVSKLKPGETTTDISRVDKTKYPGIVERINILKKKYPKWEFEFYKTGLDWDEFIMAQYDPTRTGSPRNLVSTTYKGEWICEYRGTKKYDSGNWYAASYHAIEYTADPRTYLNEFDIFSLKRENDKSNPLSKENSLKIIESALKGRTYLKYKEDIYNVSKEENIDFVEVLARLIQEQGNGTVLSDGNKASDGKIYYNPYNVAATGNTSSTIIKNATEHARSKGWDTFAKGLKGGIQLTKTNYAKQNTSYFEKFNATTGNLKDIYNQYMQNISAPFSEGKYKEKLYKNMDPDLTTQSYIFVVPLFENMQKVATREPNSNTATPNTSGQVNLEPKLPRNAILSDPDGLNMRKSPSSSGAYIGTYKAGTKIKVLKKASNYWYEVQIISTGAKGYMCRRLGKDPDYFVFIPEPTMKNATIDYLPAENQDNPKLPLRALLTDSVYVRTAPSISGSSRVTLLAEKSLIQVNKREADKDGYIWYSISYNLKSDGSGFSNTGYMAREEVGKKNYYFAFLEPIDINKTEVEVKPPSTTTPKPTPAPAAKDVVLSNQKNPSLPRVAVLDEAVRVRRGSGSTSSATIRILPKGSKISVRKKVANSNGYEWYHIYYNWNGKGFDNTGYMARNVVGSTKYYFRFITNPDWSTCAFLKSIKASTPTKTTSSSTKTSTTTVGYPRTAKTTTRLNVRRGTGSIYAPIRVLLPTNATISIRKRVADKDGYTWYLIYYNRVNGKYQNAGYVSRNALRSTNYYFKYI